MFKRFYFYFLSWTMQADRHQKELEICRNDLTTCLEASAQIQRSLILLPSQSLNTSSSSSSSSSHYTGHCLVSSGYCICELLILFFSYICCLNGYRQLDEKEILVGQLTLQCTELQNELDLLKVICVL